MKHPRHLLALLSLATILIPCLSGCTPGNATLVAAVGPDESIERTARFVADGKLDAAWQTLPPSYRDDITEIVHRGAEQMDAELWNRTFTVLQKTTRILREKRDFILDHPMLAASIENRAEVEESWGSVVGLLDVVVHSDLANLDAVKRLDVEKFLGDTGSKLWSDLGQASKLTPDDSFAKAMNGLRATRATVLSMEGDTARVRVEVPDKPTKEEDYVRVEEHWIPARVAEGWDAMLDETREKLSRLSGEDGATNRRMALMQLSMVESVLDNLQAAKTREEFHAGLGAAMGVVMGSAMSMSRTGAEPDARIAPGD